MGPSGSGKTTILNLVGGLDHADSGEVIVGGEHLESLSGGALAKWRSRHIGFVFQFYNLMPMLSAAGNVELPLLLTNLSKSERKRRVASGAGDCGPEGPCQPQAGRNVGRPAAARGHRARHRGGSRRILLCDEPTGDLDRATADEILGLLQQLNRQHKKTIVMVTHDPKAADHASRQLEMDKGTLVERGAVAA